MLDIVSHKSAGTCKVVSNLTTYKDDEAHLGAKLRLRFELDDAADARAWHGTEEAPIFPGLEAKFLAVQDPDFASKWPAEQWVPIGGFQTRFTLATQRATESAPGIEKVPCTILKAVAKVTHGGTFVDVSVRFGGLDDEGVKQFMSLLRGTLHCEVESGQQTMFPEEKGEAA